MELDKRKQYGPYMYVTKHGVGPGTLPKDVELVKWQDIDDNLTAIWTDRFLTTKELEYYDIYPETSEIARQVRSTVFESLTEDDVKKLSDLDLTEVELSHILSLFNLIDDENKDKAIEIIYNIFYNKKLVSKDDVEVKEKVSSYTRRLLGDI